MDHYLSKPIKSDLLKTLLDQIFSQIAVEPRAVAEDTPTEPVRESRRMSDSRAAQFDFCAGMLQGDEEVLAIITPMFLDAYEGHLQSYSSQWRKRTPSCYIEAPILLKGLVGNFNASPVEELAKLSN